MGQPLLRIDTTWTGVSGTPWRTRLCFPWDGSRDAGDVAEGMIADFWTSIGSELGRGLTWHLPLAVPVLDSATGALVDYLGAGGGAGTPGNYAGNNPTQSQACIRLGTVGRSAHRLIQGRLYVPGLSAAAYELDRPLLLQSWRDSTEQAVRDHLLTPPSSSPGLVLSVWSQAAGELAQVISATADPYTTTLRSRGQR